MIQNFTPRQAGLALITVAVAALGSAFIAQYAFGLAPCVLCIYQRIPYAVVLFLGLALAWAPEKYPRAILGLSALAFLIGAGIAGFHVGVEQRWWEGTNSCGIKLEGNSIEELRQHILNAPRVSCTDVAWSLFGISMAGYNALMSLGLFVLTSFYLVKKKDL